MRVLGLDYGSRYIGVAISDQEARVAVPKEIWIVTSRKEIRKNLEAVIQNENVTKIVVGMPRRLDGEETTQTQATKVFISWLRRILAVPVESIDERMTTKLATLYQKEARKQGKRPDAFAAQIILQNYLDKQCQS